VREWFYHDKGSKERNVRDEGMLERRRMLQMDKMKLLVSPLGEDALSSPSPINLL